MRRIKSIQEFLDAICNRDSLIDDSKKQKSRTITQRY